MRPLAVVVLALAIAGSGCGTMPGEVPPLEQTGWRAVLVDGRQPVAGREPTLRFAGGQITGSDVCSRITGGFTFEGDRLELRDLTVEWVGCPPPVGDIEGALTKVLSRAETARFIGEHLVIAGPGVELVLRRDSTVR